MQENSNRITMVLVGKYVDFYILDYGVIRKRVLGDPFSTDPEDIVLSPMSRYEMVMLNGWNHVGCMSPKIHP